MPELSQQLFRNQSGTVLIKRYRRANTFLDIGAIVVDDIFIYSHLMLLLGSGTSSESLLCVLFFFCVCSLYLFMCLSLCLGVCVYMWTCCNTMAQPYATTRYHTLRATVPHIQQQQQQLPELDQWHFPGSMCVCLCVPSHVVQCLVVGGFNVGYHSDSKPHMCKELYIV